MNRPPLHVPYNPKASKRKPRRCLTRIFLKDSGRPLALSEKPATIAPSAEGTSFSLPFIFEQKGGEKKTLRMRTQEDEAIAKVRRKSATPTCRAIKMANALTLETLLTTGKFGSATSLAKRLGVSQPHITGMLNMLNLPPAEIERILFEVK